MLTIPSSTGGFVISGFGVILVGFGDILVIFKFWGILVIFEDFRVLWSFTLYGHFDNWVGWDLPIIIGLGWVWVRSN